MLRFLLVPVALVMTSAAALASNWTPIPGQPGTFVDTKSVRQDEYPNSPIVAMPHKTYTVVWLAMTDDKNNFTAKLEVAFDCHGKAGVIQQLVMNDSKDAPFHTFDKTSAFNFSGIEASSVAPDSFYDGAQAIVCPSRGKK